MNNNYILCHTLVNNKREHTLTITNRPPHTHAYTNTHIITYTHTLIGPVPIYMIHISKSFSVIRTQNKPEVSIWGVEMFYIQAIFGSQKCTVECKLWCQNSLWYVCSKSPLNHTHVLFAASCGIKWYVFYVLPLFLRSLHVAAFMWAWHSCRVRKAN